MFMRNILRKCPFMKILESQFSVLSFLSFKVLSCIVNLVFLGVFSLSKMKISNVNNIFLI